MASPAFTEDDRHFMRVALSLSKRGLGNVWPNPSVGCVIVSPDGEIVGRGFTRPGGRPHAERVALDMAGARARGATAYVTLEPCSHFGKSPPCAAGLIEAGIVRVVSALQDPDERVCGRGHAMLRDAGIVVDAGLYADQAQAINAGFLSRITRARPLVTLKLASTMDGRSALSNGQSQWITGDISRQRGHLLRASHDGILVGAKTVLADNPDLTCRLPGRAAHSPIRVMIDGQGVIGADCQIAQTAGQTPAWLITDAMRHNTVSRKFTETSVKILSARCVKDHLDLNDVFAVLADQGLTRVLVESGGALAAALLRAGLVDRIVHFSAPNLIGADGQAMLAELGLTALENMPRYRRTDFDKSGDDMMVTYERITE